MRKLLFLWCAAVMLMNVLTACNSSEAPPETTSFPAETSSLPAETPSATPETKELTEDELYQQFQQAYEECGGSASQKDEQLIAELAILKEMAETGDKTWPEDYESRYQSWRIEIIGERIAALEAEYDEIIADRKHYSPAQYGDYTEFRPPKILRGTLSGLFYADYLDFDDNGVPELILLTWPKHEDAGDYTAAVLEVYWEEENHAAKCFEQKIDSISLQGTKFELVTCNQSIYLQVSGNEMHQGFDSDEYCIFGMEDGHFGVVNWLTYESIVDDPFVEDYVYEINCRSMNPDGSYTELTEEQYRSIVEKYQSKQDIGYVDYDRDPSIDYAGVLPPIRRTSAKIELNGQLLNLSAEAYASDGAVMAPLRDVLEAMGISVYANSDASVVLASTKKDTLTIENWDFIYAEEGIHQGSDWKADRYSCYFNSLESYYMGDNFSTVWAAMSDGKLFASVDKIVTLFGARVRWDSSTNTLKIAAADIPAADCMSSSELTAMVDFSFDEAVKIGEQNGYMFFAMGVGQYDGGHYFAHGKAFWEYYALKTGEEAQIVYSESGLASVTNLHYISVASDGTIMVDYAIIAQ